MSRTKNRYKYSKAVDTKYAADVNITNCGGFILWLEIPRNTDEYALTQEEFAISEDNVFGRVTKKKIYNTSKGSYIVHNRRRIYLSEFYRRGA